MPVPMAPATIVKNKAVYLRWPRGNTCFEICGKTAEKRHKHTHYHLSEIFLVCLFALLQNIANVVVISRDFFCADNCWKLLMFLKFSGDERTQPIVFTGGLGRLVVWDSNRGTPTWRIIPVSKWLLTPIYKPFRPFIRGITPLRGLTNHGY